MEINKTINNTKTSRKAWIDGLRGLAMLFVLYGHLAAEWKEFFVFTSAIKIPLFFAITGYVFKTRDGDLKRFLKNIAIKLGIPWIVLTLLPVKLLYLLLKMDFSGILKYTYKFISGGIYWYMPCCIIAEIIFFVVLTRCINDKLVSIVLIFVTIIGFLLARFNMAGFAQLRVACIAQLFILIGYLFRKNEEMLDEKGIGPYLFGITTIIYIALAVLTLVFYPGQCMDIHVVRYYNLPICMAMILTGLIAVFLIFRRFYKTAGVLSFIGQNTLVFYMIGNQCKNITVSALNRIGILKAETPLVWLIKLVLICIECAVISYILNRWFPILVGKSQKKSSLFEN